MKFAYATNDKEALGLILCSGPQQAIQSKTIIIRCYFTRLHALSNICIINRTFARLSRYYIVIFIIYITI